MGDGAHARLFVALDLPDGPLDVLEAWRAGALSAAEGLRLPPRETLHVTLCFLGGRPEGDVERIGALAVACAAPLPDLSLSTPVWLPLRRPRVLAVGIEDGEGALERVRACVVAAMAAGAGHAPEARPFLPHVTVARVRGGRGRGGGGPGGGALPPLAPVPPVRFDGAALTLYRSLPSPSGARYEPQARVVL